MIEPVRMSQPTTWQLPKDWSKTTGDELKGLHKLNMSSEYGHFAEPARNWKPYAVGVLLVIFYALWEVSRYGSNS